MAGLAGPLLGGGRITGALTDYATAASHSQAALPRPRELPVPACPGSGRAAAARGGGGGGAVQPLPAPERSRCGGEWSRAGCAAAELPPWPGTRCPRASVGWISTSLTRTNLWTSRKRRRRRRASQAPTLARWTGSCGNILPGAAARARPSHPSRPCPCPACQSRGPRVRSPWPQAFLSSAALELVLHLRPAALRIPQGGHV